MSEKASREDTVHLMRILRVAMQDPALSGGCFLLAEIFEAIAGEDAALTLLDEVPGWKMPGLLLSAALLFRAFADYSHPLAGWLPDSGLPLDDTFRKVVRETLVREHDELSALMARHTYQCNPPRRMAVSALVAATVTGGWPPALHIDIGTASGVGLLLGDVQVTCGGTLGPPDAALKYPLELRGAPLDLAGLEALKIERSVGIDLDPPNLRNADCLAWMRACQFPLAAELSYFDTAIALVLARNPRIERGSAVDLLPSIVSDMPSGQPLLVTDTYVSLFMSENQREELRSELDEIAQSRPVVWISNNSLVPPGSSPNRTTAGTSIPSELIERNRHELFGAVCVTTWPAGKRTPRLVGVNHPSGCWLEWRPDLSA